MHPAAENDVTPELVTGASGRGQRQIQQEEAQHVGKPESEALVWIKEEPPKDKAFSVPVLGGWSES